MSVDNKFHKGNGDDGKHYWLTPDDLYRELDNEFSFDFDPCPFPLPKGFDGLTSDWGKSNYVNPPFGSIMHQGPNDKKPKKKGPTAWARKCIAEKEKGNKSVMVFPMDKWVLMMIEHCSEIRNLGDVKWLATEDNSQGKGLGRHIGMFVLDPDAKSRGDLEKQNQELKRKLGLAVEALEFYKNTNSHLIPPEDLVTGFKGMSAKSPVEHDKGQRARQALKEIKDEQ